MRPLLCLVLLCVGLPDSALAFTPISQQREVSLEIERETFVCTWTIGFPYQCPTPYLGHTIENFSDAETAPDLADWSATAAVPEFPATSASLSSTTSPITLSAQGSRSAFARGILSADIPFVQFTMGGEDHDTSSHYEVSFDLSEATRYSLVGTLTAYTDFPWSSGQSSVSLTGPGGIVVSTDLVVPRDCGEFECNLETPAAAEGLLAPGTYTLTAATQAHTVGLHRYSENSSGSFQVSLTLVPAVPLLPPAAAVLLAALLGAAPLVRRRVAPPGAARAG